LRMKTNWYRRMLLSYMPIFLFTVTVLIFLSMIAVNEISQRETVKADRITTGYTADRLSRSLRGIELDVLDEVQKNEHFRSWINSDATREDRQVILDAAGNLREIAASDTLIDSVYLYRQSDKSVLTSNGVIDWNSFADREYVSWALSTTPGQWWSEIRLYHKFSTEQDQRVISMHKRTPLPFGDEGLIVINVDVYAVEQMVLSMNNDNVSFIDVRDAAGNLVFSTRSAGWSGQEEPGGEVLNRVELEELGWVFESGIARETLFMWVSVISYVWVVIGVLTVLGAGAYMLYITRKNYKPIRHLMSRIESVQLSKDEFGKKMDELSIIDKALESLIQQTSDYEKQRHENLLVGRRQLFHDLIAGNRLENVEERLIQLKLVQPGERFDRLAFIAVEIGHYGDFTSGFSVRDQYALKFALTNVLQELAQEEGMFGWAEWIADNRMGIVVNVQAERADYASVVRTFAQRGKSWVAEHLKLSLLFGAGVEAGSWKELKQSYRSASEALRHRMSFGDEAIIISGELPGDSGLHWFAHVQAGSELVKSFRLAGPWRESLDAMFEHVRSDRLKDDEIMLLLQTVLDMLGGELSGLSDELRQHFTGQAAELWKQKADNATGLEQLKSHFTEHLAEIYRTYVAYSETKNHHALINEMKAYIEENFDNPDLSLKHLSDRFSISGKYASYLFKEEFDMKFVDFLVQLRIERAQQLLADTEDSIQDIATSVGYANSITFGRVFKRVVGVTPGDYRRLRLKPDKARNGNDF